MIVDVMVTSAGGIIGQGIIKSLKLSNKSASSPVRYKIFGVDSNPLAAGLYRSDAAAVVPNATSMDYVEAITDTCRKNSISAVFVASDSELLPLAEAKEKIENECNAKVLAGPADMISVARDKWKTYEFCKANNIPFADSALPIDSERFIKDFGFPAVVKPREGYGSVYFSVVHDKAQMERAIAEIQAAGWHPMIQRYVHSVLDHVDGGLNGMEGINEFTTGITVDKSAKTIMSSISMKKILKSGQTYRAFIDDFPVTRKSAEAIALSMHAPGPINVQAKLEGDTPIIFEINPRLSASCAMRAVAGINEPDIIYRNFVCDEDIRIGHHKQLVCLRYLNEVYVPISVYSTFLANKEISNSDSNSSYIPDYF